MRLVVIVFLTAACSTTAPVAEAPASAPLVEPVADAAPAAEWSAFGESFVEGEAVQLGALLATAESLEGQTVTVEGRVSEVCQKAGCWLVLSEGEQHVRVRMKDHAFSVDKGGAGREGQVQGQLMARNLDPAEVAHFASETREGGVVPEQAVVSGKAWEIEATAVRLR